MKQCGCATLPHRSDCPAAGFGTVIGGASSTSWDPRFREEYARIREAGRSSGFVWQGGGQSMPATGEQPLPVAGNQDVFPEVIRDLTMRLMRGITTYGKPLQTNNGRNALKDAYEEALDLAMYLKQAIMEQEQSLAEATPPPPDYLASLYGK